jgi:hypothetical protein
LTSDYLPRNDNNYDITSLNYRPLALPSLYPIEQHGFGSDGRAFSDWKESGRRSNSFELPHLSHAEVAATPDRGRGHAFGGKCSGRKDRLDEVSSGEFALAPGKRPLRAIHA